PSGGPGSLQAGRGRPAPMCSVSMLASSKEPDIRPALFSKTEVDTSRRQITEMPAPVDCEVLMRLAPKLLHLHRILTLHPARRMHVHRLVLAIHAILILQPVSHHLELQHTHCA